VKCTKPAAKLEFYVQKNVGGAKVQYQNLSLWKKAKTSPSGNIGTIHPSANFFSRKFPPADWKAK